MRPRGFALQKRKRAEGCRYQPRPTRPSAANEKLRIRLRELAEQWWHWGYRRVHILLDREGWQVNIKRVDRRLDGVTAIGAEVKLSEKISLLRTSTGSVSRMMTCHFNSGISTSVQFPFVLLSVRAFMSLSGCVRKSRRP